MEDLDAIREIANQYENNPLPESFVSSAVVELNGKIVSFGVIRNHCELLFYGTGRFRDRAGSLNELMEQAFKECKESGIEQVYVYAQDENFALVLERKFGFSRSPFIPMFKDL